MRIHVAADGRASVISLIVIAGFLLCLFCNLPGHLSYDSVIQLLEGRNGAYENWHPPFMSWLLGVGDAVLPGAALFVVGDAALAFGALIALIILARRRSWLAACVAAAIIVTPQFLIYQGIVWKDVLFANLGVCAFVALAVSARYWTQTRARYMALAISILFFAAAALTRQNGVLVLFAGACALGWMAVRAEGRRAGAIYGAGILLVTLAIVGTANLLLGLRIEGSSGPARQFRLLEFYDITGLIKAHPGLPLAVLDMRAPILAHEIRVDAVGLYTPTRNDPLAANARIQTALNATPPEIVRTQWLALVWRELPAYLKLRTDIFRWIFLTPDIGQCVPYYVGVDGPLPEMEDLGLVERFDDRDEALDFYGSLFIGTPVLSHGFYAITGLFVSVVLLRRRRSEDIAMAGLLAAAALFSASFFSIGIACDYRYLYFLDLAAMIAGFYLSLDFDRPAWSRRAVL
ncbi:MAG: hypothetical protein GC166_12100 [Alphaproteobacteria bacterium]|nr:hypothetical protein [Alphaproteobacteria bacterium]